MQRMVATFRSTANALLLGAATICVAIGCADNSAAPKKTTTPANTTAMTADKPKDEPQLAKTTPAEDAKEAKEIAANRAKLSPADQKLADAQEWCVVNNEERLGGMMGVPVKLTIKGETVFLCCKSCKSDAEKDPEKTLAKLAELKAKKKLESEKKPDEKK
jgi:hypothetical protein